MIEALARKLNKLTPPIISQAHNTWRFLCQRIKPRKVGGFLFSSAVNNRIGCLQAKVNIQLSLAAELIYKGT